MTGNVSALTESDDESVACGFSAADGAESPQREQQTDDARAHSGPETGGSAALTNGDETAGSEGRGGLGGEAGAKDQERQQRRRQRQQQQQLRWHLGEEPVLSISSREG